MDTNLILVTGMAYGVLGALVLFHSHRSVYAAATQVVAGYPRVLARLRVKRIDGHFGLALLGWSVILQMLAAAGYSVPLAGWRYPALATAAVLVLYALWRHLAWRDACAPRSGASRGRAVGMRVWETRRSFRLRQAALEEAPRLRELEAALERRLGSAPLPLAG